MKLITAIVQDKDANRLADAFTEADIRSTRLQSAGGFLRSGNATFLVAIEDERLDEVLDVIKTHSQTRRQFTTPPMQLDYVMTEATPIEVEVGGATVIVQDVEQFYHF
jgi:uncharacterized protein YaaQ